MLPRVRPSLRESSMVRLRRRPTIALVMGSFLALAVPAAASELLVERLGVSRGDLCAEVLLVDLFEPRTRGAVASGLPITVRFSTELWRDRSHWFDENVDARVESFRVRWDPRERTYTLTRPGPGRRVDEYERLDELVTDLSHRVLVVHPRWALDARSRYFITVEVAVRPLTLDEFRDLDGWVGGQIRGGDEPSDAPSDESSEEGISGAVLGFLLDLSGFGDIILRQRTPPFRPTEVVDLPSEAQEPPGSDN